MFVLNMFSDITRENFLEFLHLSKEFEILGDVIESKKLEFGACFVNISSLKDQHGENTAFYEEEIATSLDMYLDQHGNELMDIPIQSLYRIFTHKSLNLKDHDLAYTEIKKSYERSGNEDIFILLGTLDGHKLSEENLIESFREEKERCNHIPRVDFSYVSSLIGRNKTLEAKVNDLEHMIKESENQAGYENSKQQDEHHDYTKEQFCSIQRIQEEHKSAINALKEEYSKEITQIKEDNLNAISDLNEKHAKEIEDIQKEHSIALQSLLSMQETTLKTLHEEHSKEMQKIKDDNSSCITEINEKHEKEIESIRKEHFVESERIHKDYMLQINEKAQGIFSMLNEKNDQKCFDPFFIASSSSGDVYNLLNPNSTDYISSFPDEMLKITIKLKEAININCCKIYFASHNFPKSFKICINKKRVMSVDNAKDMQFQSDPRELRFDSRECNEFKIVQTEPNWSDDTRIDIREIKLIFKNVGFSKNVLQKFISANKDPHTWPIVIKSSCSDFNSFYKSFSNKIFSTNDVPNSWFQVELTKGLAVLTGFRLRIGKSSQIRNFKIICTDDVNKPEESWIKAYESKNEPKNNLIKNNIFENPTPPVRYIRLVQTGPNYDNNNRLSFYYFDVIGKFI